MVAMDGLHTLHDERAKYDDPYDDRYNSTWDGASLKPYRTKDEYLYAMREDLAEWLSNLYDLDILPESFFDRLENGTVLCQHANNVRKVAIDFLARNFPENGDSDTVHGIFVAHDELRFRLDAKPGTFLARDNVSNFIHWCRHSLRIKDVLLFESDDLVMRKNDRSFILCLLEVARRGGLVGMPVPMLVQLEQEIDRELNAGTPSEPDSYTSTEPASPSSATTTDVEPESEPESDGKPMDYSSSPEPSPQRRGSFIPKMKPKPKPKSRGISSCHSPEPEDNGQPRKQITLKPDVLKTLDELVRDLVKQCTCPVQFPMIREAEGKYRIGDSNTLIFVRILRKHVMVRVGGGWDTLTHYLDKHDPCRCTVHKKRRSMAGADFGPPATRSPHKRKTSVDHSQLYQTSNGQGSDGGSSQSETSEYKSASPAATPRRDDITSVRPRTAPSSPSRRQSTGETYRPNSLNLSVRNSPRPLRRGSSMGSSSHVVTSPDSSDTYSNPDLGEGVTPTKDATPKRASSRASGTSRRGASDSDSTACSEPVSVKSAGSPIKRRNSSRNLASNNNNKTSQTATEEFLRRKRQQARAQSAHGGDLIVNREQIIHSAPTSPTRRRGAPLYSSLRVPKSREMVRRATVCAAEQKWNENAPARKSRNETHADSKVPLPRDHSASPRLGRRSSTPTGAARRKVRPQSARLSGEEPRRNSRTEEPVLMISRNSDGRHRVDSTSSCESNDSSVKSGQRSLSGMATRRVLESEIGARSRYRSMSLERSNGITDRNGPGERRRSLFERTTSDRRKPSQDRSSSSNRRKSSVERPSSYGQSDKVQVRSRSLSRDTQSNRLKVPKPNNNRKAALGASASARSSPVRRRRSDIPYISPDAWDHRRDDLEGSISSGASSPIGGPASGIPPATRSRLRPPTAIPKHLKPDPSVMTSIRKDPVRDHRPSRIPIPTSHKRMMEAQTRTRSNSLPSILADLLQAWQSVQNSTQELKNMDPFDTSPCLSSEGESISPTLSVRTAPDVQHDSGYEDNNSQKYSPNLGNLLPILPSPESTSEQS